jgi:uncharacterized membrane protein YhaH (DUF805 family)
MDWGWLFKSFEGRINRAKFWAGVLILWIVSVLALGITGTFQIQYLTGQAFPIVSTVSWVAVGILWLGFAYISLAIYAKRWHDRDKSGWWSLLSLVPFVSWFATGSMLLPGLLAFVVTTWIMIECGCLPGTEGPNRYGADPLAV